MITSVQDLLIRADRHTKHAGMKESLCLASNQLNDTELQCVIAALKSGYINAARRVVADTSVLEITLTPAGMIELLFIPRIAA